MRVVDRGTRSHREMVRENRVTENRVIQITLFSITFRRARHYTEQ